MRNIIKGISMLRKFFTIAMVLLVMSGCVGTVKVVDEAPLENIKGTTMQAKVDNNSTKK